MNAVYLQLHAGGGGFTDRLAGRLESGPTYALALGAEVASHYLAFELRYQGARASHPPGGFDVYLNTFCILLRHNFTNRIIRPYFTAGLGLLWIDSLRADPPSGPASDALAPFDNRGLVVPVGGGIRYEPVPQVAVGVEGLYYWIVAGGETRDPGTYGTGFWAVTALLAIKLSAR